MRKLISIQGTNLKDNEYRNNYKEKNETLLKSVDYFNDQELTSSHLPGTTQGLIKVKKAHVGFALFDTPGIPNKGQLYTLIENHEDMMSAIIRKRVKPYNIQVKSGTTIWLGGLARLDVLKKGDVNLSICMGEHVTIHKTAAERAESAYENHAGTMLRPSYSLDKSKIEWETHELVIEGNGKEIAISGLGWVGVGGTNFAQILLKIPKGVQFGVREGLTPFEIPSKGLMKHSPIPKNMTTRKNRVLSEKYKERLESTKRDLLAQEQTILLEKKNEDNSI